MSTPDKRDTARTQLLGGLRGEVMVYQAITITEISRSGVQVESAFPLQPNSLHDFRLSLGDRSVVVKGRVAHCESTDVDQNPARYRSGIHFVAPSEPVAAAIAEFVTVVEIGE